MGLWVMMLLGAVGLPSLGVFWWVGRRNARQERARLRAMDGDWPEAEEMLVAFGATQEWV